MRLNKDLREFVELLNSNGVEYLVVGAFAVASHGYPRFTADIDFLVRPAGANAEAVVATLEEFGFGSLGITVENLSRPYQVVQLGVKPNRIRNKEATGRPKDRGDAAELGKREPKR
jgi:hypothetical protein